MTIVASNNYTISKVSDGSPGPTGAPGQIYQQATEPTTKVVNMLWQYTGTTTITASGATIAPSNIYVWTGTTWKLWSITVANLIADKLSSIVSTLGDVTSGSITNPIYSGSYNGGHNILDTGTVVIGNDGIILNWQHLIDSILDSSQQNKFGTEGLSLTKFNPSGQVTKDILIDVNTGIEVNGTSFTQSVATSFSIGYGLVANAIKIGKTVTVSVSQLATVQNLVLALMNETIPVGWRPISDAYIPLDAAGNGIWGSSNMVKFSPDGRIYQTTSSGGAQQNWMGSASYIIA